MGSEMCIRDSIFAYANYLHIQPDLEAVQQLETYHRLLNAASGRELVVGQETPDIPAFQTLIRQANLLQRCSLLEELGIISSSEATPEPEEADAQGQTSETPETPETAGERSVREYLENLVITQQLMGLQVLIRQGCSQFAQVPETEVAAQAHHLCQQGRIYLLNPDDRPVEQLVSYRPL